MPLRPMPLLHVHGKTIFFAHVPKTGGTSVEDYLIRRFGPAALLGRNDHAAARGTSLITSAGHLSALDLSEVLPPNLDWCFTVVRDPVKRMISEYKFQRGYSRLTRLSFSFWLRVVISAARRDPRVYDNHIRPQVDLLPEGTEVFRLEDGLDRVIERLDDVLEQKEPDLEMGHLLKKPSDPVPMTREDLRLIVDYYSEDYERLGYPKPNYDEHPADAGAVLRDALAVPVAQAVVSRQRRAWLQV